MTSLLWQLHQMQSWIIPVGSETMLENP